MTTFTTEDRIIAEQNGSVTINVEPIPFAGLITITESVPKFTDLTDEQILEIWRENSRVYPMDRSRILDRSRAILRKAQGK
jgi:hypothetical protein